MNYHFDTPNRPTLAVEITAGDLRVSTHDEPVVDVTLEPMGDPDRAAKLIEQIRVEQRGDTVSVVYPRSHGKLFGGRGEVRTVIRAPQGSNASVQSGSADFTATGELGDVRVTIGSGDTDLAHVQTLRARSGSGDVRVAQVAGNAEAKTGSGDVELGPVGGSVNVSTASGNSRLGSVGGTANVKAASGDIVVAESGDSLEATSASGDVLVERVRRGEVRAKAASGDIRVGVADGVAVLLDVTTISGRVRSQLEQTDAPADSDGARVTVHTVSGDIDLIRV